MTPIREFFVGIASRSSAFTTCVVESVEELIDVQVAFANYRENLDSFAKGIAVFIEDVKCHRVVRVDCRIVFVVVA